MRIGIDTEAANDSNAHKWLDRIIDTFDDGWHVWDTSSHVDMSEFESTTWLSGEGRKEKKIRELLRESIRRSAWDSYELYKKHIRVTTNPIEDCEFTPENAAQLAKEPLCILVENRRSDGAFVKRVMRELNKGLRDLLDRADEAIKIDSVGGISQMPATIRDKVRNHTFRPRIIAIADSDRHAPDDNEKYWNSKGSH